MFIWFWDQVPGNKSLGSKSPKGTHVLLAFKINSLEQKSGGQKFSRNSCPFSFEKNLKNQNLGNKRHLGNKCPFSFGNKSLGNKSLEKKVLRPIIPQYRISAQGRYLVISNWNTVHRVGFVQVNVADRAIFKNGSSIQFGSFGKCICQTCNHSIYIRTVNY